jgi:hypothetical protein
LNYGYVVVEGPHDVEFVGRLLKLQGLRRITRLSDLDAFWAPILPRSWPIQDDLARRVPVPVFFRSATHSVAVHSAIGDSRIAAAVQETLTVIGDANRFVGIGAILDADSEDDPTQRFERVREGLNRFLPALPSRAGEVSGTEPRTGAFVVPDNAASGTLAG